jgi:putative tryptophan/tyrosine transport system substrate-binding protein
MRRREFIFVVSAACIGAPSRARAESTYKRLGILMSAPLPPLDTLRQVLGDLGYREDRNLRLETRFAEGSEQRYPALASDLVASRVDVIVTWGTPATLAAKSATATIPIVMAAIGDPVAIGAVSSLARPGGNITGLSTLNTELEDKRLEILKEMVPNLSRLGVLSNAKSAYAIDAVGRLRLGAAAKGFSIEVAEVHDRDDLSTQLRKLADARPDAVVVVADSFLTAHHQRISHAMAENRLPAIYGYREAAVAGGLIAYGADYHDLFRRAAGYVDRILKGTSPGNMPIEQPTRFEMLVNLKSAKALGLNVSESFLLRADEIIE